MIPVAVEPETVDVQDARPVASDTRVLPIHGDPPVILICHATSSLAHGVSVPIPTSPEVSILIVSLLFVLNTRA